MPVDKPPLESSENDLVERSRNGDAQAFAELVRRHRAKAHVIANSIIRDTHLAEDIVQEALIQAFLYLSNLIDPTNFTPWFYRIIKNQSLMKVRGSKSSREVPISSLAISDDPTGRNYSTDLDSILYYMSFRQSDSARAQDPLQHAIHEDFFREVRDLLNCLSRRERDAFEAYFFAQLEPKEIAELLSLSLNNVHQLISRSKQKMRSERYRVHLKQYLHEQSQLPAINAIHEYRPAEPRWKRCKTSIASCFHSLLQYMDKQDMTLTDVMGLSTHAFRITVESERIEPAGHWMYYWEPVFQQGLANLGISCTYTGDGGIEPSPVMLAKGLDHIRGTINRGIPIIAWDLHSPEFGIIYGYNDLRQTLKTDDASGQGELPYIRLGHGLSGGLFLLSFEAVAESPPGSLLNALKMIIRHAYGERVFTGHVTGLRAYDAWIHSLQSGKIDALGNAYCAEKVANARSFAADFLQGLQFTLKGEAKKAAADASQQYEKVYRNWESLCELFPFPDGAAPDSPVSIKKGTSLLLSARNSEHAGIRALERLASLLHKDPEYASRPAH